ncbi:hypothetical protein CYMTET_15926 [Cymbomonas tetramitiformis]|uniref:Uncharacterized protein n=1 Tax=Cymbomonas tetramitiformis TaxID=36881 RepID=A0AAE0GDL4_9CHLO|nr:hypothetical protein CYMTET_15926 [Cymbomonas tetramitiformis]
MAFGKKKFAPPIGEWKRQETGGRYYLTWEGPTSAGRSAAPHRMASIGGGCPAGSLSSGARAPSAGSFPAAEAAAMTVRLSTPVPTFAHGPMDPQSMVMDPGTYSTDTSLPAEDCVGGGGVHPPISSLHICDLDDDDTDWPAFRESPVWTPSIDRNNSGSTVAGLRAPPFGGAE